MDQEFSLFHIDKIPTLHNQVCVILLISKKSLCRSSQTKKKKKKCRKLWFENGATHSSLVQKNGPCVYYSHRSNLKKKNENHKSYSYNCIEKLNSK